MLDLLSVVARFFHDYVQMEKGEGSFVGAEVSSHSEPPPPLRLEPERTAAETRLSLTVTGWTERVGSRPWCRAGMQARRLWSCPLGCHALSLCDPPQTWATSPSGQEWCVPCDTWSWQVKHCLPVSAACAHNREIRVNGKGGWSIRLEMMSHQRFHTFKDLQLTTHYRGKEMVNCSFECEMSVLMRTEETFPRVLFVLCICSEFGAIPSSAADNKDHAQTDSGTHRKWWVTEVFSPATSSVCHAGLSIALSSLRSALTLHWVNESGDRWTDGDGQRDEWIMDDDYNASLVTDREFKSDAGRGRGAYPRVPVCRLWKMGKNNDVSGQNKSM